MSSSFEIIETALGYRSVRPLPTAEDLSAFYRDQYFQNSASSTYQQSYSDNELAQIDLKCRQILLALNLAGASRPGGRLLDVGCGEGFLLQAARKSGWKVSGIDFSAFGVEKFHPDLAGFLRTGDAYAHLRDFAEKGQTFDACVLQNVIEHVIDPEDLLEKIRAVLAPGGHVIVKAPNDFSAVQLRARELGYIGQDFWVCPPQHLHYFTAQSLAGLMSAKGFQVVDVFADFPIDWFLMHPGSNYIADRSRGKSAHQARVELDLLLSAQGDERYHELCRALAACGTGRDVSVLARR